MSFISDEMLPAIFMALMGLSMLLYAILDGYDLGVGMIMTGQSESHRDQMIASIGPFWDANETWLVLGVGLLLVAFPLAHGVVLSALYVPVSLMLAGLILRGVSFDFRAKVATAKKLLWDRLFAFGSLLATLTQGYMLGQYILGFNQSKLAIVFSLLSAFCVASGYSLMGASWLIMKSTGSLQQLAIERAKLSLWATAAGLLLVSIINPLVSDVIFAKWFAWPQIIWLAPLPLSSAFLLWLLHRELKGLPRPQDKRCWLPFACSISLFVLSFAGLAYSFYPFIVPGQLTVWEAASAPASLRVMLVGCVIVLPAILGYTVLSYWIFRGKSTALKYY